MVVKINPANFSKRLKSLMESNNETIYTLAERFHLSPPTISRYTNGLMSPKITTVAEMARYFNVNDLWLMGYENEQKTRIDEEVDGSLELKEIFDILDEDGYDVDSIDKYGKLFITKNDETIGSFWEGDLLRNYDLLKGKNDITADDIMGVPSTELSFDNTFSIETKKFPLLGEIACGEPMYADEDLESYVTVGTDIEADFCLKCKGDSMINARILDGDIVFIRKQSMVDNGEIAAVIIDNEATLKRVEYFRNQNLLLLKAENPKYETLTYNNETLDQIRILGKAVAFQSDVR